MGKKVLSLVVILFILVLISILGFYAYRLGYFSRLGVGGSNMVSINTQTKDASPSAQNNESESIFSTYVPEKDEASEDTDGNWMTESDYTKMDYERMDVCISDFKPEDVPESFISLIPDSSFKKFKSIDIDSNVMVFEDDSMLNLNYIGVMFTQVLGDKTRTLHIWGHKGGGELVSSVVNPGDYIFIEQSEGRSINVTFFCNVQ